jgi:hypothetical protein
MVVGWAPWWMGQTERTSLLTVGEVAFAKRDGSSGSFCDCNCTHLVDSCCRRILRGLTLAITWPREDIDSYELHAVTAQVYGDVRCSSL